MVEQINMSGTSTWGAKSPNAMPEEELFQDKPFVEKGKDILLFGDSNTGKTYIASTCPAPIFFIDTEGRADLTKKYYFNNKDIKIFCPLEVRLDFNEQNAVEKAINPTESIMKIKKAIAQLGKKAQLGQIKGGTIVVDSMSDIWSWCQEDGKERLAKAGKIDSLTFRMKNQFDWGPITQEYLNILISLKKFTEYGINVVITSREKSTPPEYVKASEPTTFDEKIKTQKDTAYYMSTIIHLTARQMKTETGAIKKRRFAKIEKLESVSSIENLVEDITYDKLMEILDAKRKELLGGAQK